MLNKFLGLIHTLLCIAIGYTLWYFIIWFFTNQSNPFFWSQFSKIMFILFGMLAAESFRNAEIDIEIKKKKDE